MLNENDSISTYELQSMEKFGDNDTLSAVVRHWCRQDLLILLSDIDGLFTDDPNINPDARFIDLVENLDEEFLEMGKSTSKSTVGTGGMATKLTAARLPLLQEWIWSLPMGLISILSTRSQRAVTTVPYLWVSPEKSFILSILLINYYKNTGGIYLWRQKRLNGSMHWHIRRKA